jgi:hypothetical protein
VPLQQQDQWFTRCRATAGYIITMRMGKPGTPRTWQELGARPTSSITENSLEARVGPVPAPVIGDERNVRFGLG